MTRNKTNVETKERALIMTRTFDAPRELVFETYTSCDHLNEWWGPREWPLSYCDMDFREGGVWHYCMQGPNGDESWGRVVYREIVEPERIVYVDNFSDEDGNINEEMPGTLVTVEFADLEGKTEVTCSSQYTSPEELEKVLDMGVVEGFTETWDRLEEHLATVRSVS